jgi:predicted RNA binding protein YcfA (HicA-like mRNA interferase family)
VSQWPSSKAQKVLRALLRIGWSIKRTSGSHKVLEREGFPDYVFAFHDREELGPRMLARISKHTGLESGDL